MEKNCLFENLRNKFPYKQIYEKDKDRTDESKRLYQITAYLLLDCITLINSSLLFKPIVTLVKLCNETLD